MPCAINYVISLLCVGTMIAGIRQSPDSNACVLQVSLAKACDETPDDKKLLFVRYLPNGKLFLNTQSMSEAQLLKSVADIMAVMEDKTVWIAADERVHYGEVVSLAEKNQD
jgi:biopolymer transport protein ExbD